MHGYYSRLNQLPFDRLLHKVFVTDKKLFYKGSKSWISCINETEKMLGIQNLEKFSKDAFVNKLKTCFKSRLDITLRLLLIVNFNFLVIYIMILLCRIT